jgi:hypothetical protein
VAEGLADDLHVDADDERVAEVVIADGQEWAR